MKLPLKEIIDLLLSGNIVAFGFYDQPLDGYLKLPISIDVPKIDIRTPWLCFETKAYSAYL